MLPQRRPAWLFFVSHKPKSVIRFLPYFVFVSSRQQRSCLNHSGLWRNADGFSIFLPDSNTKKYRHPATSSARKSPKSDHRRRYGFR